MSKTRKNEDPKGSTMSLGDHLEELRIRLILAIGGLASAFFVCLAFGGWIISFVETPYIKAMGEDARLQTIAPTEGFVSFMEVSMIAAVVVASPWIFYQLWQFISAGLYPKEKRYVYMAVPFSTMLFVTGALFFIFVIAPVTMRFLVMFDRRVLHSSPNWTFPQYLSFVATMMLVFGLAFQTPIAIFFLNKTGLVSIKALRKSRKYVVLGVVFIAAAATPGSDLFSLFALAIPMYLLFELGILISYLANRRKRLENGR